MKPQAMPLVALVLAGCATSPPPVVVPREVVTPVYSCPAPPQLPPKPKALLSEPWSHTAGRNDSQAYIKRLEAHIEALRALLAPYTRERTANPHEPSE